MFQEGSDLGFFVVLAAQIIDDYSKNNVGEM